MTRRARLLLVVALSVTALGSCSPTGSAPTFGDEAARQLRTTLPTASSAPDAPAPSIAVRPAVPPEPEEVIAPVRLEVPAIGVTARVESTGVDEKGEFAVPPSVDSVGWYRFGPALDAREGSIVVGGHVDAATTGPGAFYRLKDLEEGDQVILSDGQALTRTFRVIAREQVAKKKLDLTPYFATTGQLRLTLFTCGGEFIRAERSYQDNVIVTAVPV